MKKLQSIIEDRAGNVIGAITDDGCLMLPDAQTFPRSELIDRARDLSAAFGVEIPAAVEPILPDPV